MATLLGTNAEGLRHHRVPLTPGIEYLVAAVAFGPSVPWFYVLDRSPGLLAPIDAPCLLFEVRDSRLSRSWRNGISVDRLGHKHGFLAPERWAKDPLFHGRVFEGDEEAVRQMAAIASDLLVEFPLPWISARAVAVGSGNWVADETWSDSWEADPAQAMTTNPKTGALLHNPLFVGP